MPIEWRIDGVLKPAETRMMSLIRDEMPTAQWRVYRWETNPCILFSLDARRQLGNGVMDLILA
jgi:hypothetical protein